MTKQLPYLVFDAETNIKNIGDDAVGNNQASPFHPDNQMVWMGWKFEGTCTKTYESKNVFSKHLSSHIADRTSFLIGHNIKFDLHYLMKTTSVWVEWLHTSTNRIWDTQLAEYILSRQAVIYPTLDYCANKRGGTVKDSRIKEYWKVGFDTEDIPKEEIVPYLEGDVNNTELVFLSQVQEAQERGMLPLIQSQMEALMATIEMEWNGLYFNKLEALQYAVNTLLPERDALTKDISDIIQFHLPSTIPNPNSNDQISQVLFGGKYKVKEDVQQFDEYGEPIRYKGGARAGKIKTKKENVWYVAEGMNYKTREEWKTAKAGIFTTNDKVLKSIDSPFTKDLLRLRELNKDINTYYIGWSDLVWGGDQCIHGSLNHCATATGRLSSTNPNYQNASSKTED